MAAPRLNALDQALDIAGSLFQQSNLTLSDEVAGLRPLWLQSMLPMSPLLV